MSCTEVVKMERGKEEPSVEIYSSPPSLDLNKFFDRFVRKSSKSPSIEHVEAIEASESMSGAERYASVAYILLVLNDVVKTPEQLNTLLGEINERSATTPNPNKIAKEIDKINQDQLVMEFTRDLLPVAARQAEHYQEAGNFSERKAFHAETAKFGEMASLKTLKTLSGSRAAIGNITRKGTEDTLRVMAQMIDQKVNPPEEETTELHAVE